MTIDDEVMARLGQEAARQGKTVSELVEAAVRSILGQRPDDVEPPAWPRFDGGGTAVNVADRDELYRAMESR